MLKFSNLTLAQKRFIVAVIETKPSCKESQSITLKECGEVYDTLRADRAGAKGEKVGYPNWLFKTNKVARGIYRVPVPTAAELSAYAKELADKQTPAVAKAKAKVAKLAKAKVIKTKAKTQDVEDESETQIDGSRLNRIIAESEPFDSDVEDFNQILRENGIEV